MRIMIVANPSSCRGRGAAKLTRFLSYLDREIAASTENHTYEIAETKAAGKAIATGDLVPGSGGETARQAASDGFDIVAAAGGDGTVGEVANGLVGSSATLAVIPTGTGNDFSRTLGVGTDLALAARTVLHGTRRAIDLGRIDRGGYFVNVAGCGFDAEVAYRINHGFRKIRGTTAYIAGVIQTLRTFKPSKITLTIDGVDFEETVMLCAVANARSYGGGMKIAPEADLSDGLFDIVLVGDASRSEFLRAFPSVFKGTHLSHPKVKMLRGSAVSIRSGTPMPTLADGEEIGTLPAEFRIERNAIQVLVPKAP